MKPAFERWLQQRWYGGEQPGLGLMEFRAAEDDPSALIGKVTIDASAK